MASGRQRVSVLQIDQVSKLYQASAFGGDLTPALRGVSFGIGRGEVVTLIGESGSGKTTLGRIILRLASPSGGRVMFDGNDIAGLRRTGLRLACPHSPVQEVLRCAH